MNSAELLDTARGFVALLTQDNAQKMSDFGSATVNAANMTAKIENFEAGRSHQNAGRGAGVAATAETKETMKRLRSTRSTTAKIGTNILEESGDAGLLGEWKSVCKVEKTGKSAPKPPG